MKALSIRLDDDLGKEFEKVCQKTGYKKNTLVTRLIASFVRHQKQVFPKGKKANNPFAEVIGVIQSDSLLSAAEDIDRAVYDL